MGAVTLSVIDTHPFGLWGSYFNQVDLAWLQDTLRNQLAQLTEENQLDWLSREVLLAGEVFSDIFGRTANLLLLALWLNLATRTVKHRKVSASGWLQAALLCYQL